MNTEEAQRQAGILKRHEEKPGAQKFTYDVSIRLELHEDVDQRMELAQTVQERKHETEMNALLKDIDQHQKRINAMRPLPKELVTQIRAYYKVGLTYGSNALEGNSLTETETKVILEDRITIGGKPLKDHYEALGHAEAYDFLFPRQTIFRRS